MIIPTDLPLGITKLLNDSAHITDQEELLKFFYYKLTNNFISRRFTLFRLDRFLIHDLDTLWNKKGFLHCNHQNYFLRTLLVASGKFKPEDIVSKWCTIWLFSPHQYLEIHLQNGKTVTLDLWGRTYGIPYGKYAHGFEYGGSLLPVVKTLI